MKNNIIALIRSFQGYTYEVAGVLTAYFEDPEQARACAEKILEEWKKQVEVNGTSLTVYI